MHRRTVAALASLAIAIGLGLAGAGASGAAPQAAPHDDTWCVQQGGAQIDYSPWANTNYHPIRLGGAQSLCVFTNDEDNTHILVAADSLEADRPTLAALAYTRMPDAEPGNGSANPAAVYCAKIGGTTQFGTHASDVGGWAPSDQDSPTDFSVMCVFGDRSMIDEWGLFYHKNGIVRGADLAGKWAADIPAQ